MDGSVCVSMSGCVWLVFVCVKLGIPEIPQNLQASNSQRVPTKRNRFVGSAFHCCRAIGIHFF